MPETINQALIAAHDQLANISDTARLDAETLLADLLQIDRTALFARWSDLIPEHTKHEFSKRIQRRIHHEPVAYIIGRKFFWESEFIVTPDVLIPRPDTETLVEQAIVTAEAMYEKYKRPLSIIDLGCGSGCIGISVAFSLLSKNPNILARVVLADVSVNALKVARKNAETILKNKKSLSLFEFYESDWFKNISDTFDLVLSNPPYIAASDTRVYAGAAFEPSSALYSEGLTVADDGLKCIHAILTEGQTKIKTDGIFLIEFGKDQEIVVQKMLANKEFENLQAKFFKDLSGTARVFCVEKIRRD